MKKDDFHEENAKMELLRVRLICRISKEIIAVNK